MPDNFICKQCGACCRQPGFVYLTLQDAERFASGLRMNVYEFTETYCLLLDRRHLTLKKRPDEACLFLGEKGCSAYEHRPAQCRDFPLQWKTERSLDYCEGLKGRRASAD